MCNVECKTDYLEVKYDFNPNLIIIWQNKSLINIYFSFKSINSSYDSENSYYYNMYLTTYLEFIDLF